MVVIPGKNFESQRGFPTPNEAIETSACRTFRVPASDDWLGLLMGAVELLTLEYNWYQWGDLTPAEAVAAWQEIVWEAYEASFDATCIADVPAPFWDTAADSDDEASAETQDWYGVYDGDFTAQLADWAIAGFIAYSGNVGAAISFLTIAPRFRLAWKTGDLGGIIRVFVDAVDVGTVDTFSDSPGVITRDYLGDPEEEEHQIIMVLEEL